jgi:mRNA interferase HicA
VKRRLLIAHLRTNQCALLREGAKHSVFVNPSTNQTSTVPRHSEIDDFLAAKICRDLGIPQP